MNRPDQGRLLPNCPALAAGYNPRREGGAECQSRDAEAMNTISEADIHRAANLVITRYGCAAVIEAARMVERMLELGDPDGRALNGPHWVL